MADILDVCDGTRLLLISNRLPVSVTVRNRRVTYTQSIGGVAVGLNAVSRNFQSLWIGALNLAREDVEGELDSVEKLLRDEYKCHPLVLSRDEIDGFYNGLSNSLLWPLFHNIVYPDSVPDDWWKHYVQVNKKFCASILAVVKPRDVIWINDYHFFLLPSMLRRALPRHKIGFFLHIPFPDPRKLAPLSFRNELLEGLLGADLIGVYTERYKNNLIEFLGTQFSRRKTPSFSRNALYDSVKVKVFQLGVDAPRINEELQSAEVQNSVLALRTKFAGKKVILSADRLDYTKGIPQKLIAYKNLLDTCPELKEIVQFVLIVAPCRMNIIRYIQLKRDVSSLVRRINARYRTSSWEPIYFIDRALTYQELLAYYKIADLSVITSLEDAMNIMAKEYLYVKGGEGGALVLSRNAGAALELTEAYQVDPADVINIMNAMREALCVGDTEIARRNAPMLVHINRQTAAKWVNDFLGSL